MLIVFIVLCSTLSLNMSTEKYVGPPPQWRDGKSYEIYNKELALWEFSCEGVLDKKKRCGKVVLGMPDGDDLGIKTKILENLSYTIKNGDWIKSCV